jgi:hypothetical protein
MGPIPQGMERDQQLKRPNWEEVMEWFSKKTSIAGVQIPNWMVVLGAVIVIVLIYQFMR